MRKREQKRSVNPSTFNFQYLLDIDVGIRYNCDDNFCDMICRCGKITYTKVNEFNYLDIVDSFTKKVYPKLTCDYKKYAIERFLSRLTPDDFYVDIVGGYYGQETGSVSIEDCTFLTSMEKLKNPSEIMESVLELEYGYVHERLKSKKWKIEKDVNPERVVDPNPYKKIDSVRVANYSLEKEVFCVAELRDGRYILMDGHHRHIAATTSKKTKLNVIYGRD